MRGHVVLMGGRICAKITGNFIPLHAFLDVVVELFVGVGSPFGMVVFCQGNSRTVLMAEEIRNAGLLVALV